MSIEVSIQEIEAARLSTEVRRFLAIGHGYEGHGSMCPLVRRPVPRCKPGYQPAPNGLRRRAYLQLH